MYYDNPSASSIANSTLAYLFYSNGSSLADWTVVGSTVNTTVGVPPPSFSVAPTQYAYIKAIPDYNSSQLYEIDTDFNTPFETDYFFLDNSTGGGLKVRWDEGGTYFSSILPSVNWATWGASLTGLGTAPTNVWFSAKIFNTNSTYINVTDTYGTSEIYPSQNLGGYKIGRAHV